MWFFLHSPRVCVCVLIIYVCAFITDAFCANSMRDVFSAVATRFPSVCARWAEHDRSKRAGESEKTSQPPQSARVCLENARIGGAVERAISFSLRGHEISACTECERAARRGDVVGVFFIPSLVWVFCRFMQCDLSSLPGSDIALMRAYLRRHEILGRIQSADFDIFHMRANRSSMLHSAFIFLFNRYVIAHNCVANYPFEFQAGFTRTVERRCDHTQKVTPPFAMYSHSLCRLSFLNGCTYVYI